MEGESPTLSYILHFIKNDSPKYFLVKNLQAFGVWGICLFHPIKIVQIHISYNSSHLYVLWIASCYDIRLKVMGKFHVSTGLLGYWIGKVTTGESLFPNIFGW